MFVRKERENQKTGDARPDLDTPFLMVANDAHSTLAELDNTFLLQFLNCLDQT